MPIQDSVNAVDWENAPVAAGSAAPDEGKCVSEELYAAKKIIFEDGFVSDGEENTADSTDWEDSSSDSDGSTKHLFQRVEINPNLVSRPSLLTQSLHQANRTAALQNMVPKPQSRVEQWRTMSLNGPSITASRKDEPILELGAHVPISKPAEMAASGRTLSPQSIRRKMIAEEFSSSCKIQVLRERQKNNVIPKAVPKRRHTTDDMARLENNAEHRNVSKSKTWNSKELNEYCSRVW